MCRSRSARHDWRTFQNQFKTLSSIKASDDETLALLQSIARLLWRADFSEGSAAHLQWLHAFRDGLPDPLRDQWIDQVLASMPDKQDKAAVTSNSEPLQGSRPPIRGWLVERSQAFLNRVIRPGVSLSSGRSSQLPASIISGETYLVEPPTKRLRVESDTQLAPEAEAAEAMPTQAESPATTDPADSPYAIHSASATLVEDTEVQAETGTVDMVETQAPLLPRLLSRHDQKMPSCCICKDLPVRPKVAALCGHFACGECWRKWIVMKFECPVCRGKVRPNNLIQLQGWCDT